MKRLQTKLEEAALILVIHNLIGRQQFKAIIDELERRRIEKRNKRIKKKPK